MDNLDILPVSCIVWVDFKILTILHIVAYWIGQCVPLFILHL